LDFSVDPVNLGLHAVDADLVLRHRQGQSL